MPQTLTISLAQPIATCRVIETAASGSAGAEAPAENHLEAQQLAALKAEQLQRQRDLDQKEQALAQLCETINGIAKKLNDLHQHTVAQNRGDIAKLAVEIARKILRWKTDEGDYEIQSIVEEALKQAPTREKLVVRVNAEDLAKCQKLQEENPDSQFAELELVADWGIAPADCLIETPKGIVRSFVTEHLDRIGDALARAQ